MIGTGLVLAVAAVLLVSGKATPQATACLTNADTAAMHVRAVSQIVSFTDSSTLVNQGLPYQPSEGVTLVTSSQVCSKVVAAYNSPVPAGDSRRITAAYVMKVGRSAYAAVGSKTTPNSRVVYFYNTKYQWLAAMAEMD
jgi:hypothetical protein